MEKSRLADFRGQIAVGAAEMALLLQAAELALSIRGLTSQAEREGLERIVARFPTRRRAAL